MHNCIAAKPRRAHEQQLLFSSTIPFYAEIPMYNLHQTLHDNAVLLFQLTRITSSLYLVRFLHISKNQVGPNVPYRNETHQYQNSLSKTACRPPSVAIDSYSHS